jgi:phosphomethylpyrimidine synthase
MKITEDVRKFAAQQGISDEAATEEGLKQKATGFTKSGAEIYSHTEVPVPLTRS